MSLSEKNKRIIKNTGLLYFRMFFVMAAGLYTSRALLQILGVEDFGVYYVVIGLVAILGFMQGAMTTATQRFFSFDIGRNEGSELNSMFNASFQVHAVLAVAIIIFAETIGYWFVVEKINIPINRKEAALIAYHLSVFSFAVGVMTIPFVAMLMAHEQMRTFATISIIETFLKLFAVLLLPLFLVDKLVFYSFLMVFVSFSIFIIYFLSHRKCFPDIKIKFNGERENFAKILNFTAWNTMGNLAAAMSEHGNNLLLNIFFGPLVNAAKTISGQANSALNNFVNNVQAAINPQIIKSYASGDWNGMHLLVVRSAKYNYFILLILSMPVILYTESFLNLWLAKVPEYSVVFLKLTIVTSLINSMSGALMTAAQATGNIRKYHTVVGCVLLLSVPIGYFFLKNGYSPTAIFFVAIVLSVMATISRLYIILPLINMSWAYFCKSVFLKIMPVSVFFLVFYLFCSGDGGFELLESFILFISSIFIVLFLGLSLGERKSILGFLIRFKRRG